MCISYTLDMGPLIKLGAKRGPLLAGHQNLGSKTANPQNTETHRELPSQLELGTTFTPFFWRCRIVRHSKVKEEKGLLGFKGGTNVIGFKRL